MGKKFGVWFIVAAIICSVFLVGAPQVQAAGPWYVDPLGTDDVTHGLGTGASAFKTIKYAVETDGRVVAGDTINVAAGTYTETITINKANLTLQSSAGAATTFIDGGGTAGAVVNITASGITFDGFTVQNSTSAIATGILTSNGTIPEDGNTVKIGAKTYTFKTTLTSVEGQVLIGGSAAVALDNLKSAINRSGTPSVGYYCAAVHPTVTASTNTDTTQTVIAKTAGGVGNTYVSTTPNGTTLSWGSPKLTGGSEAYGIILEGVSGSTIKNSVVRNIYGESYVFGLYVNNSNNNTVSNITISNLDQTTWVDYNGAWGVWLALSDNNIFADVTVNDLLSASDSGGFMLRSGVDGNSFTRSTISNLTSTDASVWGSPAGITIWSGTYACNNNIFTDTNISDLLDQTTSTFDGWGAGIQVRGSSVGVINTGNKFINSSISDISSAGYTYGVAVTTGSSVILDGGSITNITANPATPGSARGVNIWKDQWPVAAPSDASAATITNMTISVGAGAGAGYGVAVRSGINASLTSIHSSNITGNTTFGIINTGNGTIDATNNWWGSNSGPYQATTNPLGTGDTVSATVTYTPWATNTTTTATTNTATTLTFHEGTIAIGTPGAGTGAGFPLSGQPFGTTNPSSLGLRAAQWWDISFTPSGWTGSVTINVAYNHALGEETFRLYYWDGAAWQLAGNQVNGGHSGSGDVLAHYIRGTVPVAMMGGTGFGLFGNPSAMPSMDWWALAILCLSMLGVATLALYRRRYMKD